jgi:O-antigen ligase
MTAPLGDRWRLTLAALLVAGCVASVCAVFPDSYLLLIAALIAVPAFFVIAAWRPEAFLVGCVFMPQWKSVWPLDRFGGAADLTVVMLLGLFVGVLWRSLRHVSRLERDNFSQLFRGQWLVLSSYILFCAVVLASYTYTSAPNYGGVKLVRFLMIGSLFLFSGIILIRNENEFRRTSLLFVAAACITALQMIFQLQHRSLLAETDITRIGAGWLLGMSILLLLAYPIVRSPRFKLVFVFIALPLLTAGLIASAARGPFVSLVLTLPLTVLWFSKHRFSAGWIGVSALLIASCLGSYVYLRQLDPGKYSSKLSEMVMLSQGDSTSGSGGKRLTFYSQTLAAIPDHFWLGQGIGSWSVFYSGRDMRYYPHNLFLETTFEEGVLGQILLLLFLCLLAAGTHKMLIATEFHYGVLAGLLAYCVSVSMFSGDLDDDRILWLWAGITIAICRNAYLQRRRLGLVRLYKRDEERPVHGTGSRQSVFAHSHVLKG